MDLVPDQPKTRQRVEIPIVLRWTRTSKRPAADLLTAMTTSQGIPAVVEDPASTCSTVPQP